MPRLELDGVPGHLLAKRWGVPQCGLFRQLGSTLDAIHELAGQGAAEGSVVLAEEQTAGRGRDGRTWHSPAGGVWLGMLFRPARATLGVVSIRAGLIVAEVVDEVVAGGGSGRATRSVAQLKWPNDVVIGARGRKLAGVLCEGRWQGEAPQWLAVGIGINVQNPIPADVAERAVALSELRPEIRRLDVLDKLVPALRVLTAGGVALVEAECVAYASRDWLRGRQVRSPLFGRAAGIRPDGALLIDSGTAPAAVREGHVELA